MTTKRAKRTRPTIERITEIRGRLGGQEDWIMGENMQATVRDLLAEIDALIEERDKMHQLANETTSEYDRRIASERDQLAGQVTILRTALMTAIATLKRDGHEKLPEVLERVL